MNSKNLCNDRSSDVFAPTEGRDTLADNAILVNCEYLSVLEYAKYVVCDGRQLKEKSTKDGELVAG